MADASSTVSYAWQQVKGPTAVVWSGQNTVKPTVEGLVFGTYQFRLTVTDAGGKSATATLDEAEVLAPEEISRMQGGEIQERGLAFRVASRLQQEDGQRSRGSCNTRTRRWWRHAELDQCRWQSDPGQVH